MGPLLGAHMSISGGLDQALARGRDLGCATVQIFTKNANQWKEREIEQDEITRFRELRSETGIHPVISHGGYLVNLASPDPVIHQKSLRAALQELRRCESLGIDYLVIHPGAHRGEGMSRGMRRLIEAIDSLHQWTPSFRVRILLETTAGQGTYIGSKLEEIAGIINGIAEPRRIGFCLDTCHVFAAGYRLRSESDCERLFDRVEETMGLSGLKVIHLNDSLQARGSKTDRHAHIGRGKIGTTAFRWIMRNPLLEDIPKIIETPKEEGMDRKNLDLLRGYLRT